MVNTARAAVRNRGLLRLPSVICVSGAQVFKLLSILFSRAVSKELDWKQRHWVWIGANIWYWPCRWRLYLLEHSNNPLISFLVLYNKATGFSTVTLYLATLLNLFNSVLVNFCGLSYVRICISSGRSDSLIFSFIIYVLFILSSCLVLCLTLGVLQ